MYCIIGEKTGKEMTQERKEVLSQGEKVLRDDY